MIIKSFKANSAVRALKQVREELGPDAIVLKTRQIHTRAGGTMVEITACLEKPTVGTADVVLKAGHAAANAATATAVPNDVVSRLRSKPLPLPDEPPGPAPKPTKRPSIAGNRIKEFVPERIVREPEEAKRLLDDAMPEFKQADLADKTGEEPKAEPEAELKPTVEDLPVESDKDSNQQEDDNSAEAKAEEVRKPAEEETSAEADNSAVDEPLEVEATETTSVIETESVPSIVSESLDELSVRLERIESGLNSLTTRVTSPAILTPNRHGQIQTICTQLLAADFTEEFVNRFASELLLSDGATESLEETARKALVKSVAEHMVPHFDFVAGDRLTFIGAAGSGKSSVMGKLAFRLVVKDHMKTRLATLDNQKMGAHDEIASYADILDVPLLDTAKTGAKAASSEAETHDPEAITLIDTPALPTDADDLDRLQRKLDRYRPSNCFMVVSSLMRSADVVEMCRRAEQLAPSHIIATMIDQTWRLGPAIAAAVALKRKIAFVNAGPGGIGQLSSPDPNALVRTVLKAEVGLE